MTTKVVHFRKAPYDVYIGRPSIWGNPIRLNHDTQSERQKVLVAYARYLLTQPDLLVKASQELRGKVLGCWCSPRKCHGDILAMVADAEDPQEALCVWLQTQEPEVTPTLFDFL